MNGNGIDIPAPKKKEEKYEADDGALTDDQIKQIREAVKDELPSGEVISKESLFEEPMARPRFEGFAGFPWVFSGLGNNPTKEETPVEDNEDGEDDGEIMDTERVAERAWKAENPDSTLKKQRQLYRTGQIDVLPWNTPEFRAMLTHKTIHTGFGKNFPNNPEKGDLFVYTDSIPSTLFRFNGTNWIEVDKHLTDSYAYNDAYIDHLIEKLANGEYDPEYLSDAERANIEHKLNQKV